MVVVGVVVGWVIPIPDPAPLPYNPTYPLAATRAATLRLQCSCRAMTRAADSG